MLFHSSDKEKLFKRLSRQMVSDLKAKPDKDVVDIHPQTLAESLYDLHCLNRVVLDWNRTTESRTEKAAVPASKATTLDSRIFSKIDVCTLQVPIVGDHRLLKIKVPDPGELHHTITISMTEPKFDVNRDYNLRNSLFNLTEGKVQVEFILSNDAPNLTESIRTVQTYLARNLEKALEHAEHINQQLRTLAAQEAQERIKQALAYRNALEAAGIPLKKNRPPEVLEIPAPELRRKIEVQHTAGPVKQEPTLRPSDYQELLSIFYELGKVFERLPSLHQGKGEEAIRDLLLMNLAMRVQGTITGETYNVNGKTDILLRYENSNLFAAECKFWHGPKQYLETITQLLSYLTWRDSKVAVLMFVRDTKLSTVLQKIQEVTPQHTHFLAFVSRKAESWFEYRFHINGDPGREVQLAVLAIYVPEA